MSKLYQFTLLKQDGTEEDMGTRHDDMPLAELYKILNCQMVECIPTDYYTRSDVILWGDEEGRFNSENHRNPHFKVLHDPTGAPWDVVGDILLQEEL